MQMYLKKLYEKEEFESISFNQYLSKNYQYHFCTQEGASLISKQGTVKKKKNGYLFQHQGHTNKMESEYLESYVWIYAYASDLNQVVVL